MCRLQERRNQGQQNAGNDKKGEERRTPVAQDVQNLFLELLPGWVPAIKDLLGRSVLKIEQLRSSHRPVTANLDRRDRKHRE